MAINEHTLLLSNFNIDLKTKGLSIFFAVICVIDVFGVFPIVALPRPIIQCGLLGIPLILFVFSLQIYTAILLGKCWVIAEEIDKNIVTKSRYPYAAIAEMTFGKHTARIVTFLLDVTVFGGGIPNLLVASQNLQLFGIRMSNNEFDFSFCYWLLILGTILCPFLWLGSPKDMKVLCSVSVITVLSVCVMTWICMLYDQTENVVPSFSESTSWQNIISAYGIIAFQFDIHPMLLTIHVDMNNKQKIACVVLCGFIVTGCMFFITTLIAFYKYGLDTHPNILQGLPPSLPLYLTVLLVTLQLCMTSAVGNSALYQNVEDYLSVPRDFNPRRCLVRSVLTALAVFVAESVPRFDLVMSLIGGTLTGPLVFIFPPLFYIKMLSLQNTHKYKLSLRTANHLMYHDELDDEIICLDACLDGLQKLNLKNEIENIAPQKKNQNKYGKIIFAVLVIIFGVFATILTTYSNICDVIKYATFTPPCLYNITAASLNIN